MRLSIKPIKNYQNINSFDYTSEWQIRQGESSVLYLQLVDLDQDSLRYMSQASELSVRAIFPSSSGTVVEKTATQASIYDKSIFQIQLSDSDTVYTGNVRFEIVEDSVIKRFSAIQVLTVEPINNGGC